MRKLFTRTKLRLLAATLWAILVMMAAALLVMSRPAAAGQVAGAVIIGDGQGVAQAAIRPIGMVVPVDRGLPELEAKIWTDRGRDAVYQPGESLRISFRVDDDAYVCVYNIDSEGRLRVLFPAHPGASGRVRGGHTMTLPARGADYEFVASGPAGMELLVIVASRAPLASAWYDPSLDGVLMEDGSYYDDGDGWASWSEPAEWHEIDEYGDVDGEVGDDGVWRVPDAAWSVHGLLVVGDPFVAIRRVNDHLLEPSCADRDVATDYVAFHVEQRVEYPRYVCGDCHGWGHPYDPYADACAVFSVSINTHWTYHPHRVYVVGPGWGPRYVYVRHDHAPRRYWVVKRTWSSLERRELHRAFREPLGGRLAGPIPKGTRVYPKSVTDPGKSTRGYDWKTQRSPDTRTRSGDTEQHKPDWTAGRSKSASSGARGDVALRLPDDSRSRKGGETVRSSGSSHGGSGSSGTKVKSSSGPVRSKETSSSSRTKSAGSSGGKSQGSSSGSRGKNKG